MKFIVPKEIPWKIRIFLQHSKIFKLVKNDNTTKYLQQLFCLLYATTTSLVERLLDNFLSYVNVSYHDFKMVQKYSFFLFQFSRRASMCIAVHGQV